MNKELKYMIWEIAQLDSNLGARLMSAIIDFGEEKYELGLRHGFDDGSEYQIELASDREE